MTAAVTDIAFDAEEPGLTDRVLWVLLGTALALILGRAFGILPEWLIRLPEWMIPPTAEVLDVVFSFIQNDLGLVVLTRAIAEGPLEFLLDATANLLYGKRRWPMLGPIPWSAVAVAMVVLGYWLGGWRLATMAGVTFAWTALVGQWDDAMETMSVLIVAAPIAFAIGIGLGIAAWKYGWVDRALKPILAVLQTLPFFTYLLPAVIFFKVGPTAGAVATIVYAIPPMILMTTLGLKKVSPDVVEAGQMSGSTRWQMLFHVYLPAARSLSGRVVAAEDGRPIAGRRRFRLRRRARRWRLRAPSAWTARNRGRGTSARRHRRRAAARGCCGLRCPSARRSVWPRCRRP